MLILVVIGGEFFSSVRHRASYLLFTNNRLSEQIVIVAVDDQALRALGRSPTEWTRDEYIPVVNALSENGARVVAFDLLFPEPAPGDVALASAIEDARNGDMRTRFVLAAYAGGQARPATLPTGSRAARFQTQLLPIDVLRREVDYTGYGNASLDAGGALCCQFSYITVGEDIALSFSLATYLAYLRIPTEARDEVIYTAGQQLYITPQNHLLVDQYGQWIQSYTAPIGQGFETLSFLDIVEGRADLSIVEDKIVLIGLYDAVGAVDTYRVPMTDSTAEMPGVEIQANAIDTLLQGTSLREASRTEILVIISALVLLASLTYEHLRWYWRPVALVGWLIVVIALAHYAFAFHQLITPIFDGALTVGIPLVISLAHYTWREGQKRRLAEYAIGIAEREKRLLEDIILGMPTPTVILDRNLDVRTLNQMFMALLDTTVQTEQKPKLLDLLKDEGLDPAQVDDLKSRLGREQDFHIDFSFKGHSYTWSANWLPRLNRWVIALADITMLVEMNEVKRHMLLMVSHDLRNPLSALNLQLFQLRRLLGTPDSAVNRVIESAEFSAKTMQFILTDVIDLEQVRSLTFPTVRVDLERVCESIRDRYREDVQRKRHTFNLEMLHPGACIQANEGQITQMLANLVSNAIKYTQEEGIITLTLRMAPNERVRIEVNDTGIGIPKDAHGKLFTEFYRVKSRATSEVPGTGLGLSLVKTIVRRNGGQIWFESQEGIGTTFYVEFPVAATADEHP